jgi:homocysteine S-methyltransferase
MRDSIQQRLAAGRPLLLDGATGTELNARGVGIDLPLWSAAALISHPEVISQIHTDYVESGAEIITANTFRTHARNLAAADLAPHAAELTTKAVRLARQAASEQVWVAGSQAPLEDCYSPQRVPDQSCLEREHLLMSTNLADAGVDLILVETQSTVRESVAALQAATSTGLPTFVSFVCGMNGHLLSGESIASAVRGVMPFEPDAVLVNCLPINAVPGALAELQSAAGEIPCGVYANIGYSDAVQGWVNVAEDAAHYCEQARLWIDAGAKLVGGCCGTTPEHIRLIAESLNK